MHRFDAAEEPHHHCVNCLAVDRECTVNPAWGKEREYQLVRAATARKVLVVGGGPAGMETARVAALRGHRVSLYEKEPMLGGQLRLASLLREEYESLRRYLAGQMKKLGVHVELGKEVNAALIAELEPEVIVAATGATSVVPDIPGIDKDSVVTAADLRAMMRGQLRGAQGGGKRIGARRLVWYLGLNAMRVPFGPAIARRVMRNRTPLGKRVVVVGRGLPGIELAHFLVERGHAVSLVDTRPEPRFGEPPMPVLREFMKGVLLEHGTTMLTASKYEAVTDEGLCILDAQGRRAIIAGDTVVFVAEFAPDVSLVQGLDPARWEVHRIGDCASPCGILDAIRDGSRIARQI